MPGTVLVLYGAGCGTSLSQLSLQGCHLSPLLMLRPQVLILSALDVLLELPLLTEEFIALVLESLGGQAGGVGL